MAAGGEDQCAVLGREDPGRLAIDESTEELTVRAPDAERTVAHAGVTIGRWRAQRRVATTPMCANVSHCRSWTVHSRRHRPGASRASACGCGVGTSLPLPT